ncbi:MAG: hypothetical protein IPQ07_14100 [Myxococcales bacterium]|nr:hypothetical protein [Myxococcales bacterium]
MPTTTSFEALSLDALSTITGGCGKKKSCCCPPPQAAPEQAPAPQIAPSAPEVSTKVSVSGY